MLDTLSSTWAITLAVSCVEGVLSGSVFAADGLAKSTYAFSRWVQIGSVVGVGARSAIANTFTSEGIVLGDVSFLEESSASIFQSNRIANTLAGLVIEARIFLSCWASANLAFTVASYWIELLVWWTRVWIKWTSTVAALVVQSLVGVRTNWAVQTFAITASFVGFSTT